MARPVGRRAGRQRVAGGATEPRSTSGESSARTSSPSSSPRADAPWRRRCGVGEQREDVLERPLAHLPERQPHRRQRRHHGGGDVLVFVEADDRDVLRHLQPQVASGEDGARGHAVVGAEQRGGVVALQDGEGRLVAGADLSPAADGLSPPDAGRLEHAAVPGLAAGDGEESS